MFLLIVFRAASQIWKARWSTSQCEFSFNFVNFYTQFNFVDIVLHDIFIYLFGSKTFSCWSNKCKQECQLDSFLCYLHRFLVFFFPFSLSFYGISSYYLCRFLFFFYFFSFHLLFHVHHTAPVSVLVVMVNVVRSLCATLPFLILNVVDVTTIENSDEGGGGGSIEATVKCRLHSN